MADYDNGTAVLGTSATAHLVAPPIAETVLCRPNSRPTTMHPASSPTPTCKICLLKSGDPDAREPFTRRRG